MPFFFLIFISWRLITLQYCSGFCHTLTWISHGFTCVQAVLTDRSWNISKSTVSSVGLTCTPCPLQRWRGFCVFSEAGVFAAPGYLLFSLRWVTHQFLHCLTSENTLCSPYDSSRLSWETQGYEMVFCHLILLLGKEISSETFYQFSHTFFFNNLFEMNF